MLYNLQLLPVCHCTNRELNNSRISAYLYNMEAQDM